MRFVCADESKTGDEYPKRASTANQARQALRPAPAGDDTEASAGMCEY